MNRLWNYSEDEKLSVAEGTIFNSSRHRSAISDYPFPDDTDDFPTWKQMWTYLEGYADHFNLRPHIQLNSPITGLSREGKKWIVEITPKNGTSRRESFDKVAVAIGSFITPKTPKMTGIEKFAGRTLHSVNFHQPKTFKDQRVLLVGLHASSQDVAVGLEPYASQVYVTHRNGVTLVSLY